MSLNITDQQAEGKTIVLPAQLIVEKQPKTSFQSTSVAVPIPRNNIIDPFTSLYRFSTPTQTNWNVSSISGQEVLSRIYYMGTDSPGTTSMRTLFSLINDMERRMGFVVRDKYLTTSFDVVYQVLWSANPSFQGQLGLNLYENYSGFGKNLITSNYLRVFKSFPNGSIKPSEDGCYEFRISFNLPNGSAPLRTPKAVSGTASNPSHPYLNWIFGYYAIFVISRLQSKNEQTSFPIFLRYRFDKVSFNYLSSTNS